LAVTYFGNDSNGDQTLALEANYVNATRFTNNAGSGNLSEIGIRLNSNYTGLIHVGVYAVKDPDEAGHPGVLLLDAGEFLNPTAGWNTRTGLTLHVDNGVDYWLAGMSSTDSPDYINVRSVAAQYESYANSTYGPLPNPCPDIAGQQSGGLCIRAGVEAIGTISPSAIPSAEAFGYDAALSGGATPSVTNIWRECPDSRLSVDALVQKATSARDYQITVKFFEYIAGGAAQDITGAGAIASLEAFGTLGGPHFQFPSVGGIVSAEAFGGPVFTVYLVPTGVASAEAFGTSVLTAIISLLSGISSAEAFGSGQLNFSLLAPGIASAEGFGNPVFTIYVTPGGISSTEAFGAAVLQAISQLFPGGIAGAEAFGTAQANFQLLGTGIPSTEAFGTSVFSIFLLPGGIATQEAFGTVLLQAISQLFPGGIASAEGFGSAQLNFVLLASGVASAEAFGTSTFSLFLAPTGIATAEGFGAPTLVLIYTISPTGIASAEAFGTSLLNFILSASGITSLEAFGLPGVSITGGSLILIPIGIASGEAFGSSEALPFEAGWPAGEESLEVSWPAGDVPLESDWPEGEVPLESDWPPGDPPLEPPWSD